MGALTSACRAAWIARELACSVACFASPVFIWHDKRDSAHNRTGFADADVAVVVGLRSLAPLCVLPRRVRGGDHFQSANGGDSVEGRQ